MRNLVAWLVDYFPVYVVPELGYNRNSVVEGARIAIEFIERHDLRGVILLAHSKGGVMGKHLIAINDVDARVDRLTALNSSFSGSTYARYFPLRSIRAFSPTEPTLAMLEGGYNIRLPLRGHFRPLSGRLLIDTVAHETSSFSQRGSPGGC